MPAALSSRSSSCGPCSPPLAAEGSWPWLPRGACCHARSYLRPAHRRPQAQPRRRGLWGLAWDFA
eukprot:9767256-Lingulodinium_polyedra.AAC.1